ncbi:MAG TPA: CGNR zinc finger domain-containing protein [Gaiellaceae bacterium]|nr:CGNR zinc finger domain-containing protein [Gaiellaceae bacterium]
METVERIEYLTDVPPAPGRLGLVQRFVNTVAFEWERELLDSPGRLGAVLADLGLLAADAPVSERDLERALELREALRALALANVGVPAPPAAERALERAAAEGALGIRFHDGAPHLAGTAPGVAGALASLAGAVVEATANGTWPRLKACPAELCGWLFYDRSRNRSARWCDMAVCGNRAKTRAYRARRRA